MTAVSTQRIALALSAGGRSHRLLGDGDKTRRIEATVETNAAAGALTGSLSSGRVEQIRGTVAGLIDQWDGDDETARRGRLIEIRAWQDVLGKMRQRNLSLFAPSSHLAWVDTWDPDLAASEPE